MVLLLLWWWWLLLLFLLCHDGLLAMTVQVVLPPQPQHGSDRRSVEWKFAIQEAFPPLCRPAPDQRLLDYLVSFFPTNSQVRRAMRHGEIMVIHNDDDDDDNFDKEQNITTITSDMILQHHVKQQPTMMMTTMTNMMITPHHRVYRITRCRHDDNCCHYYPVEMTKHVMPPMYLLLKKTHHGDNHHDNPLLVIYENNDMAIVHKPSNMTTIDAMTSPQRDDLQSILPFVLRPPPSSSRVAKHKQKSNNNMILPKPVHRLDKDTSGLVVVAKTTRAMTRLSAMFAHRQIQKTYTAIVFGKVMNTIPFKKNVTTTTAATKSTTTSDGTAYHYLRSGVIDYPMDGKEAITKWKQQVRCQNYRYENDTASFSMLQLQPQTGRFHQLRRHLAYCLGTPIVGDEIYDLVGIPHADKNNTTTTREERISWRRHGLHLSCHGLEFEYPLPLQLLLQDNNNNKTTTILNDDARHSLKQEPQYHHHHHHSNASSSSSGRNYSYWIWTERKQQQQEQQYTNNNHGPFVKNNNNHHVAHENAQRHHHDQHAKNDDDDNEIIMVVKMRFEMDLPDDDKMLYSIFRPRP